MTRYFGDGVRLLVTCGPTLLRYDERMTRLNLLTMHSEAPFIEGDEDVFSPVRAAGLTALALGAVAVGLFVGRELRFRYKFRRRTPSDFFANAGDAINGAEYGLGV